MSKLIKKYQGSGKLYLYNQSDNTYVHLQPALMTHTAQKQRKQELNHRMQEKKQKDQQNRRDKYNLEINLARLTFNKKYQKEQEAFEEIKKGQHHNAMDQTVLKINQPMSGPTTTYQLTPEEQYIKRPVSGYDDPAGEVMSALITAPFGGSILKAAGKKLLTTRFGRRLLYDIAANEALQGTYKGISGRDLSSDINYVSGLDEDNMFGDLASFSLATSGRKVAGKLASKGLYLAALHSNIMKRAAEVAMRQDLASDGLCSSINALLYAPERTEDRLHYIITGKLADGTTKSSLGTYNGTCGVTLLLPHGIRGDLIDAYLYDNLIDPRLATYIGTSKNITLGLTLSYAKMFPNKTLRVYRTNRPEFILINIKDKPTEKTIIGHTGQIKSNVEDITFDTAGHHIIIDPVSGINTSSDVWHFTPSTYSKARLQKTTLPRESVDIPFKGINLKLETTPNFIKLGIPIMNKWTIPITIDANKLRQFGLKYIHDVGHPFVINSPARIKFYGNPPQPIATSDPDVKIVGYPTAAPKGVFSSAVEVLDKLEGVSSEEMEALKEKIAKLNIQDFIKDKPGIAKFNGSDFDADKL